jgi:hypothetical protein
MEQSKISTLTEFLEQSGAKYRVFDLGRRVTKITVEQFSHFENAYQPYPYPFQQKAFFGLVFWNPSLPEKQYVWFLSFPLDEQGLLVQAARDEFLVMLLDRVGECMLAAADGQRIEGALKDSPYAFKPREDKMAAFNAHATAALSLPASQYYQLAKDYFTGEIASEQWQQLGMQGVADFAVRLDNRDATLLAKQLAAFPAEPFGVLTTFLEHSTPSTELVEAFISLIEKQLQKDEVELAILCGCLRAISNSSATGLVHATVAKVLSSPVSSYIEVLAIISGRMSHIFQNPTLSQQFVEKLAQNEAGINGFSHLLIDAMYLPDTRVSIMTAIRNPQRSELLAKLVGQMFG